MTLPTHPCGCEGTWSIVWAEYGDGGTYTCTGYESDTPFFAYDSSINKDVLKSACDGRKMQKPWWSSNIGASKVVSRTFTKSDPNCGIPTPKKYDCINGACLEASQYNTPGIYQSLSDCEVNCGTGCSGKCISNSDWAQIKGLSNQLKNRNCS